MVDAAVQRLRMCLFRLLATNTVQLDLEMVAGQTDERGFMPCLHSKS